MHLITKGCYYYAPPSMLLREKSLSEEKIKVAMQQYQSLGLPYFVVSSNDGKNHYACFTGQENELDRVSAMMDLIMRKQEQEKGESNTLKVQERVNTIMPKFMNCLREQGWSEEMMLVPPNPKNYKIKF